jgi:hypothetical protein
MANSASPVNIQHVNLIFMFLCSCFIPGVALLGNAAFDA